jgi:RNA polymerase sigma-70 factor (ECF subfamily)
VAGSGVDVEGVAQEAFVKAYYALPRFRPGAPFRPWLLRIVANEAHNRRKASGRSASLALRWLAVQPAESVAPSPEEAVLAAERRATLLAALNDLRDDDRLAIGYRYFLGLNEDEMATALGCARGTVKSRLSRSLGRLRAKLGAAFGREAGSSTPEPGADRG